MGNPLQVLVLEDSQDDTELILRALRRAGLNPQWRRVQTEAAFLERLEEEPDLILADFTMPQFDALRALELLNAREVDIPFIIVSGSIGEDLAVSAMQEGADDYLLKDRLARLGEAVRRALQAKALREEKRRAEKARRESEARFRRLAENAPDIIFRCRVLPTPGFEYVSPAVTDLLGFRPQEFYDEPDLITRLAHPDDRHLVTSTFQGQHLPQQPLTLRWRHKDGHFLWIEQRNTPIYDEEERLIAVEGIARDVSERKRRQREQEAVAAVAYALRTAANRSQMVSSILERTRQLLQAQSVALVTLQGVNGEVTVEAAVGKWSHFSGQSLPPLVATSREVLDGGEPYATDDADVDPRVPDASLLGQSLALVCVPLIAQDKTLGAIWVGRSTPFSGDEVQVITAIADIGANALQRAETYEQTERSLRRLAALHAIDLAISNNLELGDTLDVLLEHVTTQLDVDAAAVLLLDEQEENLEYAAGRGFHTSAIVSSKVPLGKGQAGLAAERQTAIHCPDLERVSDTFVRRRLLQDEGFVSHHVVPLVAKRRVKGVLEIFLRRHMDPNGEWIEFLETLGGQAAVAIDNAHLFSETRRLLQQTRRQARQVRRIIDAMPEGVLLLDARQRILLANPLARRFLPMLTDAGIGEKLTHLGRRPVAEFLEVKTSNGGTEELDTVDADGVFEVATQPLRTDGGEEGWVLVLRDVTEEREHQQYLQSQERLAMVGQLAAGIAHDFNNIMSIITLYSEILSRNPDHKRRGHYLETIVGQAQHASNLIGQILDFSRASVMERRVIDLVSFTGDVTEMLKRTVPESIRIAVDAELEEAVINADPTRLQQALMNLAVNARDAMPDGGQLRISLSQVEIAAGQPPPLPDMDAGSWVQLSVADNGAGVHPDVLPHIFDPFFTTKERGQGTGLGLAQVHGIIKQHDGEIDVETELGEGTTFKIFLPLLPSALPAKTANEDRTAQAGRGETLLLVEDNAATAEALAEVLENLNYHVLLATEGEEALALFEQKKEEIDLIISDMVMPKMGGTALHGQLRERDAEVKMVLITGYPLEERDTDLRTQGIVASVQKPFEVEEITRAIRRALGA